MLSIYLFVCAIICAGADTTIRKAWDWPSIVEIFLGYVFLFNMGLMGLLAAYAHVFMGAETAREIGWQPGSPFQYEIGMANLSYGVLGVLAYWIRGRFWVAAAIGWSILLLGCFVGHLRDYYIYGNDAPYNIGMYVWFNDLILPIFVLTLLIANMKMKAER
jgi:hypothetical protein